MGRKEESASPLGVPTASPPPPPRPATAAPSESGVRRRRLARPEATSAAIGVSCEASVDVHEVEVEVEVRVEVGEEEASVRVLPADDAPSETRCKEALVMSSEARSGQGSACDGDSQFDASAALSSSSTPLHACAGAQVRRESEHTNW